MKTYSKNDREIKTDVGKEFSIKLDAVPGYQWDADFDNDAVELVEKKVDPGEAVGGSSRDVFVFKPVTKGDSTIRLTYKRPWETESTERVEIKVVARG